MLLKYSKDVDAYEIDPDMCERLRNDLSDERLQVFHQDFLDADLDVYREKVNICANLPYYVTTPILFKIFESDLDIARITVMVQKEVGERIRAELGSEDYGALSIEVQYLYEVETVLNVSRHVFYPQPNVDSIVIRFTPIRTRNREYEKGFFELIRSCFRMRRKTLYNNLKDLYPADAIQRVYEELGLAASVRPQELDIGQYQAIYERLNIS